MDAEALVLRGRHVTLRPAGEADVERLLSILREPAVARWWGRYDAARVREELDPSLVIEITGRVEGWLQFHEETEPDYRHVSMDIALATACHGRGHAREALAALISHFAAKGHHRFTIDPSADNERAIRCYASLGFKPVGIMREYERDETDGSWHDGLLMDLLARELIT